MFLFDFFRSFLPLHNPLGFGASDFVEFALIALLVALVLALGVYPGPLLQIIQQTFDP